MQTVYILNDLQSIAMVTDDDWDKDGNGTRFKPCPNQ